MKANAPEQYIPKSILVAEIDRLYDEKGAFYAADVLYNLEEWLDNLEVKEVDLEKEIESIDQSLFDLNGVAVKGATHFLTVEDVKDIAKHFFELGLQSTLTEEDMKLVWTIGDEIPYMSEEDFFKELLRRYKAQKGEYL